MSQSPPTFAQALRLWLHIGLLSFGGPAGQIAMMHRLLVEERRWISESRFLHALNYCMLLPGPEAQQLATYIGWLLHRTAGGLAAGLLFILPGALVMGLLAALYAGFQQVPAVQALFFGIKAAVLAVVVEALIRLGRRTLRSALLRGVAVAAFAALFFANLPFPLVILSAALFGTLIGRLRPGLLPTPPGDTVSAAADRALEAGSDHLRPSALRFVATAALWLAVWLGPLAGLAMFLGGEHVLVKIGVFFSQIAAVTFGGAYAALVYVAQQAVEVHGWLRPGQMLDGLGLAETTPGPLVLVLEFVGFLAAAQTAGEGPALLRGVAGAVVALWAVFAPSFLWIFAGAPYIERVRGNRTLAAALTAVTAAVVGVVGNLALWFGLHVLFRAMERVTVGPLGFAIPVLSSLDAVALALAAAAMLALMRFKLPLLVVLAGASVLGALAFLVRG